MFRFKWTTEFLLRVCADMGVAAHRVNPTQAGTKSKAKKKSTKGKGSKVKKGKGKKAKKATPLNKTSEGKRLKKKKGSKTKKVKKRTAHLSKQFYRVLF